MILEDLKYSLVNIMQRKMRSLLTILSILIGITAVFALMSFGLGIQSYIDNLATESGADKLFIQANGMGAPGTDANFYISKDDIDFVAKRQGVKEITGIYYGAAAVKFDDQTKYNYLFGFDPKQEKFIMEANNMDLAKGRNLKAGDSTKVVLGYNYQIADKIFKKKIALGDKIDINGQKFEVIGFYSEVGNPSDDAQVYITSATYEEMFPDKKDKYGFVMVRSEKGVDPEKLAETIKEKLRKHKGQEEGKENFYVQTFADMIATFKTVIDIINNVLVLIALISVVVAAVNIMNTMYTSVLERTREIGVMKAIGARNSEILKIFLIESGMVGFIGGVLGVILGYLVASTGGYIAAVSGYAALKPYFPVWLIVGCIIFAFLIGALSGFFPARQASRLKPVDALRYE
jgi:putative ABC transport system permease protein